MDKAAVFTACRAEADRLLAAQRPVEAEKVARAALTLVPDDHAARYTLGCALLMQGRWTEGWPHYEHRRTRLRTGLRKASFPEWKGEPLTGKRILVWSEQGLGDEIMFSRFIPQLRAAGAGEIIVGCHNLQVRAFEQLGADRVLDNTQTEVSVPKLDYWALISSLPGHLGVTPEALSGTPYLSAEPSARGGIGLVERGNPRNPVDDDRSIPEGQLQATSPQGRVLTAGGDTLDSLRQVAGLDLLITVDTSWAHMAGALGVPCWLLLPYRNLDWRWLQERTDTPWYNSVRLFRQATPGNWDEPMSAVRSALAATRFGSRWAVGT